MHPARVDRARLRVLTDLPNVGPSLAGDLRRIGIETPAQLAGQSPLALYERLCEVTGIRHDPCVLDVFMSITCFVDGGPSLPWWDYTAERKALLAH